MNKWNTMLQAEYGIEPIQIQSKQGGWASLAFEIKARDAIYFLKVYEKHRASTSKLTALIDQYVPIVVWLENNSDLKRKISVPLQTKEGNYKWEDEENIYLLYPFIDGETIGERDLTKQQVDELAHIIAALHAFGKEIPFPTGALTENFVVSFLEELEEVLHDKAEHVPGELSLFLREHRERIARWIRSIKELSEKLQSASMSKVLCHTDLHHWNLMQSENLLLIDWEGLKLAPAEADIMSLVDKPYFKRFMEVYRQYHENYQINEDALAFYQLRRRLEDIWEFTEQLLYEELDTQEKAKIIGYLTELTNDNN
ncbi:aminoglycoside phosphotransferase family protein [Oceanobacillus sp. CFH 90083]|uniref:aminoglycoside phosphotransferase family protein n=1 Tax=Oceanobacillus sp. CFH 90083 TaxID=2592336 RepID=UPI00128E86DF|nr:aminoglycoside phosphotransferase family protein [Oceanobacillus sp. CFH 90083]